MEGSAGDDEEGASGSADDGTEQQQQIQQQQDEHGPLPRASVKCAGGPPRSVGGLRLWEVRLVCFSSYSLVLLALFGLSSFFDKHAQVGGPASHR